ncbi:hypothetical protein [Cytobacillus firmus]|uniref:hypothetical protein n=1 Tax=Cytobacillus firmus TaxID=1399 RepID=UPI0018CD0AC9|nr:hypothetical protein [Cytobacillus firmus]MBG9549264.1 hypothetical protein [Cytobacillus firmus]MBG9602112.1 hypothetical protein [Cytobacillus firmus]MBG9654613.1 hypothetical protein [Cytobacillus firmus]MED1905672.1 hypothetical protein [Cytobacillus firmus]MED1940468.1 hypothetical protein [Cytobacillus firmus]
MKKSLLAALSLGLLFAVVYSLASHTEEPAKPAIPAVSLEKSICERVSEQFGEDCQRILLFDPHSRLVFAETNSGIIPVLTNQEFTEFKKFIYPMMDFQEFSEEKTDRGPIDWRADKKSEKDFSIIFGFAEDDAKTIIINSEGNIQPSRFLVRDNLWVWYAVFEKDEIKLPVEVTV